MQTKLFKAMQKWTADSSLDFKSSWQFLSCTVRVINWLNDYLIDNLLHVRHNVNASDLKLRICLIVDNFGVVFIVNTMSLNHLSSILFLYVILIYLIIIIIIIIWILQNIKKKKVTMLSLLIAYTEKESETQKQGQK